MKSNVALRGEFIPGNEKHYNKQQCDNKKYYYAEKSGDDSRKS